MTGLDISNRQSATAGLSTDRAVGARRLKGTSERFAFLLRRIQDILLFLMRHFSDFLRLKYMGSAGSLQDLALGAQSVTALIVVGPEFSPPKPRPHIYN